MNEINDIIKSLAEKYGIDPRVMKAIVLHPLLFAKKRIQDPIDTKAIRILHFGVFKLRHGVTVEDKLTRQSRYDAVQEKRRLKALESYGK